MDASEVVKSCGRIHMQDFQIAIGVLTGIALCCFVFRIIVRLKYQKRLLLDDAFLIFAVICLCTATGILYRICYFLYLHAATSLCPGVMSEVISHFKDLLSLQKKVYPFLALIWTTTFSVKLCFLVFMRPMVRHLRALNRYYWSVVVFSIISWMVCIVMPFIICPYFGLDAVQCFASRVSKPKTLGLTALVTILDIVSDLMVVALPIAVLKNSTLSRPTKFGLITFLCLSVFMAICAIIRVSGIYHKGAEDDVWEFFWQQIEGAVAVMMASITMFRTLFVPHRSPDDTAVSRTPAERLFNRCFRRFRVLAEAEPGEDASPTSSRPLLRLPKLPSPVFTGMRTFIHKDRWTEKSAVSGATLGSWNDDYDTDYHTSLKEGVQSTRNSASKNRSYGQSLGSR